MFSEEELEEELFKLGIKPAILYQYCNRDEKTRKRILDMCLENNYIALIEGESILVVRKKKQLEEKNLGYILGYYPKSVDAFLKSSKQKSLELRESILINYNGIHFNTMGYFDEALNWCHEMYREKMLKELGKIEVLKQVLTIKNGKVIKNSIHTVLCM